MTDTREHECRQAGRCAARQRDQNNTMHPAGTERPNTLCPTCEEIQFDAIHHLADDWSQVEAQYCVPATAEQAVLVTASRPNPIPIRLDVDALLNDIETELHRWARILTRGDDFPMRSWPAVKATHAAITSRLGTLIDMPSREITIMEAHPDGGDYVQRTTMDGVDAVLRLSRLHMRAEHVLQTKAVRIWMQDPCPACGRKALAASKDQSRITCQGCRAVWDKDQFARLGSVLDFDRRRPKEAS
ncbi:MULTISPECIES: hypothetical protein [unclassified Rhodococcus (in: high G+C Gram-positive bacteria)]|uniref:hypothetical protein n=1 Tax=unclassified Rhodococcus (in: high G+C Gram-positive bacteria) TaxID=192944 RepID=UPI0006FD9704|nr:MULTISPECIES: hypothetical protein [unclassified Rhodococcus (in: high G+C Gram-positive bacteria)]KQU30328.1 hypothetical protein ASG69_04525 [Rhodococcus sp. Leaf225]KQU44767.1 hypothetical protein ASH03_12615 [Rhodococcus sp. Leaf258]